MKFADIKVTRQLDGFNWTAHSQFTGEPIMRNGKPFKGEKSYADAWEASTAGHSAIALYDKDASYIVADLMAAQTVRENAASKRKA